MAEPAIHSSRFHIDAKEFLFLFAVAAGFLIGWAAHRRISANAEQGEKSTKPEPS